jgi:hypothetical protein
VALMQHRLGKKPAVLDSRTLRFGAYVDARLPPPPMEVDWGNKVSLWPMYFNDKYADCTCAAAAHMIETWTAAVGDKKTPRDAEVLKFYRHFTTPGPTNSCDMLSVLKYWRSTGLGGDKIRAFVQLELRNTDEMRNTVAIFGGCYIGMLLPEFALVASNRPTVPWVVPRQGPIGDAAPAPEGGHCVSAIGYDAHSLHVVTWGQRKSMSWQFYGDYTDEAYAVLSVDFLAKNKTPEGFDFAQLRQDVAAVEKVPATRAKIVRRR